MTTWKVRIGDRTLSIVDKLNAIDPIEAGTRALEHLYENRLSYHIGPSVEITNATTVHVCPATTILANAGRYKEAAQLQALIDKSSAPPIKE